MESSTAKARELESEEIRVVRTFDDSGNRIRKDVKETDDNGFTYYKCPYCGLTFNYISTLKAHERVHDIMQPYVCPKCNSSFHYMCELEYHMKEHSGLYLDSIFKCNLYLRSKRLEMSMWPHILSIHGSTLS